MSLTSASTLYQGRKVDLSLFPLMTENGKASSMRIGEYPRSISGAGKASQNFIRIMLSTKGDNRAYSSMGTSFWNSVKKGLNTSSRAQVFALFNSSALTAVNFIRTTWTSTTPVDEKILSVKLIDFAVSPGSVMFNAELTSGDGSSFPFLIPVAWNTGK